MSVILLIRKRTLLSAWLLICLGCLSAVFWSGSRQASVPVLSAEQESGPALQAVVIDPVHGGQDGGAVAPDGTEESGINLAISLRLEQLLRFAGIPTEMTRREDCMVCDPGLDTMRQRKVSDIRNRTALVNGIPNAVLLSIHQNSLPSSRATHGAQAFRNRQDGAETLAQLLQCNLNAVVNTHRAKEAKLIPESIYLMNHVTVPAVLVECGFLSHRGELEALKTEKYRTKIATILMATYLRFWEGPYES